MKKTRRLNVWTRIYSVGLTALVAAALLLAGLAGGPTFAQTPDTDTPPEVTTPVDAPVSTDAPTEAAPTDAPPATEAPTDAPVVTETAAATDAPTLEPTPTVEITPPPPPFIQSDKDDYFAGETVILTSGNWQPGESVHLIVNDVLGDSWRLSVDVLADDNGGFTYQFQLPDWFVAQYHVYAYGVVSGAATTDFTDARSWKLPFAGTGTGSVTLSVSSGTINVPVACGGTGTAVPGPVTVTSSCGGSNNITTSDNGATVTFNASASGGSTFGGWSAPSNLGSSTCTGTTNPCSGIFGANGSLTVTFNSNANTTTTVASSSNPSTYGNNVTFTASVKVGTTAVTSGSVTFIEGGTCAAPTTTLAGPTALNGSGQAAFSTSTLTVPSHTITACYGGAAGFNSSNGSVTQTVNKANATVTANNKSKTYGDLNPTLTATVVGQVVGGDAINYTLATTATQFSNVVLGG
ncbi:MAG: Ig-like domain repeat protein, partial [Chloroflexi bacterium]|nr:Ig-like domain repeat protein [Chloroflexota bacterium]